MAGLFFSRKSKNGVGTPTEPDVADTEALYDPIPAASMMDEPPDAIPGIPDLYGVLGVDQRASDDIIRYAYRKKAAKLLDARWRPGRAARQLAELNAAYEILGKPDRRTDYDRQRARMYYYQQTVRQEQMLNGAAMLPPSGVVLPRTDRRGAAWTRPRSPRRLMETIAIIGVVVVAFYAGYTILGTSNLVDLSGLKDAGASMGLPIGARTAPTAGPSPTSQAVLATPTPRTVIVPQVSVPSPTVPPEPTAPAASNAPGKTAVRVSNPSPPRRTEVSVSVRFTRDDKPITGVPVYLVAHYKTIEERFPENNGNVQTNVNGEATVTFNIGDATAGFPVNVDVIGTVDGEQVQAQTTFLPR
jgi:hypothetical protein